MLEVNTPGDWINESLQAGTVLYRPFDAVADRVIVVISGWPETIRESTSLTCCVLGNPESGPSQAVKLVWLGSNATASVARPASSPCTLRLSGPYPASRVTWRSHQSATRPLPTKTLVPMCLETNANHLSREIVSRPFEQLAYFLDSGKLAESLQEFGNIALNDSFENTMHAASLILEKLRDHPLMRDPSIGALIGALSRG